MGCILYRVNQIQLQMKEEKTKDEEEEEEEEEGNNTTDAPFEVRQTSRCIKTYTCSNPKRRGGKNWKNYRKMKNAMLILRRRRKRKERKRYTPFQTWLFISIYGRTFLVLEGNIRDYAIEHNLIQEINILVE